MVNKIESIIERLIRDLNKSEDLSGNQFVSRRTKIENIIEELDEICKSIESDA